MDKTDKLIYCRILDDTKFYNDLKAKFKGKNIILNIFRREQARSQEKDIQ